MASFFRRRDGAQTLPLKQGVFLGTPFSDGDCGVRFYQNKEPVCTVIRKTGPYSRVHIEGLGCALLSDRDMRKPPVPGKSTRAVVDAATGQTVFQLACIDRDRYRLLFDGETIEAVLSAEEIAFFRGSFPIARYREPEDQWRDFPVLTVELLQGLAPLQALAILSFSSLLFTPHSYKRAALLQEQNRWRPDCVEFNAAALKQNDREAFLRLMHDLHWEHDEELFWLALLEPTDDGRLMLPFSPQLYFYGSEFRQRIESLLRLLAASFPGLEAELSFRFLHDDRVRRNLLDNGGSLHLSLRDGAVTPNETYYS